MTKGRERVEEYRSWIVSPAADILRGSRRRSGVEKARCRGFDGREERSPGGLRCAQNQFLYHRTHAASCLTLRGSQD